MFKHLQLGKTVENPVFWKKVQLYVTVLGVLLPTIGALFPVAQVLVEKNVIAGTLTAIATVNVYLTAATTDKIGF